MTDIKHPDDVVKEIARLAKALGYGLTAATLIRPQVVGGSIPTYVYDDSRTDANGTDHGEYETTTLDDTSRTYAAAPKQTPEDRFKTIYADEAVARMIKRNEVFNAQYITPVTVVVTDDATTARHIARVVKNVAVAGRAVYRRLF